MARFHRLLSILLLAAALSACGGGRDAQPAAPQDAVAALRARALAVAAQAVAPDEAARQLMDFGEAQFPEFFPSHQPTQSLPPFAYRHYPQTGIYLGVVVTAGQGYEYLGVYVMGGSFGNEPQFVGPLASFITPVAPDRLVKVHAGASATYALTAAGELFATGIGSGCRLGDGTPTDRPAPVSLGKGWTSISGENRLLALKTDGSLWGWGTRVGDGTAATRCEPRKIGDGFKTAYSPDSAALDGAPPAVAVKQDGSLWAWLPAGAPVPTQIGTDTDWADAIVGKDHYLALKTDGSLWSFGDNLYGQLGLGSPVAASMTPRRVGSNTYKAMAAAWNTSYAVATDGSLYAWGWNVFGMLGDDTTTDRSSPTLIGTGFASVDAATWRVVALKADGSVWAWGENREFDPVGDGTLVPRYAPVQVASGWESVSNSEQSVLGIDRNGDTWGWDVYDYVRHMPSGNFGVLSSRVPVKFDYFAP